MVLENKKQATEQADGSTAESDKENCPENQVR